MNCPRMELEEKPVNSNFCAFSLGYPIGKGGKAKPIKIPIFENCVVF